MPRPFVILYRAREGSSALIDLLGKHPDITVPVFEDMDSATAGQFCGEDEIDRLADLTLATGDHAAARTLLESNARPAAQSFNAVGFKWRIWGDPARVTQMLADRGVLVLHLFRLQLRELATSLIFTDHILPALHASQPDAPQGGHLQFRFAAMQPEQRAAFRHQLRATRFRLDPGQFLTVAQDLMRTKRQVHETYVQPLQARGIPVHAVLYEDLLYNRAALLDALCRAIGVDPAGLRTADTWYRKVMDASLCLQVINWEEANAQPALRDTIGDYRALIHRHTPFTPARLLAA